MEYLSPSPTSRFKVLERAAVSPGKCIICGSVNRPVIDFGMSVVGYGAIYFCGLCISEAARPFGMVSALELVNNEKATDVIVQEYLFSHNLVLVSVENAATIGSLINSLYYANEHINGGVALPPNEVVPEDAPVDERQGKLFDFDNDGVVVQRIDEIDFDSFLEKPAGVSNSTKHEPRDFQLE